MLAPTDALPEMARRMDAPRRTDPRDGVGRSTMGAGGVTLATGDDADTDNGDIGGDAGVNGSTGPTSTRSTGGPSNISCIEHNIVHCRW